MNIYVWKTPIGQFKAIDQDTFDGAEDAEWPSNCVGLGDTKQSAIDDLMHALGKPYSFAVEKGRNREF